MQEEYKVFPKRYSRLLDLVEMVDKELAKRYKIFISSLPTSIERKLSEGKEFSCEGLNYKADFEIVEDMMEFQMVRVGKYFCENVQIYPFCDFELEDGVKFDESKNDDDEEIEVEDRHLFIFSLTMTDVEGEPVIRFNYEEKDGKYIYKDTEVNGLEFDYEVFIDKVGTEYYLTCIKEINGIEAYVKQIPIDYETLVEFADTAEDRNEDNIDF